MEISKENLFPHVRRNEEYKVTLKFNTSAELQACIRQYPDNVVDIIDRDIVTQDVASK